MDDHPVVRWGLRLMLTGMEGIDVVGEADGAGPALEAVEEFQPDVVLLDVRMPGTTGIELAGRLRDRRPSLKIVILTTYDDEEYLQGAFAAGVDAYLLKTAAPEELLQALRAVHGGQQTVHSSLVPKVLAQFTHLAQDQREQHGMAAADREILRLIAAGEGNREIAGKLFWSEVTVARRVQAICQKLGAANRSQAVAIAIRTGLI